MRTLVFIELLNAFRYTNICANSTHIKYERIILYGIFSCLLFKKIINSKLTSFHISIHLILWLFHSDNNSLLFFYLLFFIISIGHF